MLETRNLVRKYTHIYVVLENIPCSTRIPLTLLMSAFLAKIVSLLKVIV